MGLRQNLACQPSFLIQNLSERPWELVQPKEELWSAHSRKLLLLHKTWLWEGVWGCGSDDSDNNTLLGIFLPKALTFYLFHLKLSSKAG